MPIPWADTSLWPASNVCIRAAVHRNQKNLASYLCDRSAREILLSIGDMFVLSILFKNRWWWLFHRRRRVKTVRSNQRKHLKSGLTCIKPQQSCLISTVVASQRLPTRSCQATRWRLFLFSSSLLLLLLPLPCLPKTLEKRWTTWWILCIVLLFVRISTTWHWAGLASLGTLEKTLRWRHTWLFLDVVLVET